MRGLAPALQEHWLWPCNVAAWHYWQQVQTEYRISAEGPPWLDYAGVRAHLDEAGLQGSERREIWAGIRAADAVTREVWAEKSKQK
jgi:hypothetical protein